MNIENNIGDLFVAAVYFMALVALTLFQVVIVLIGWLYSRRSQLRSSREQTKKPVEADKLEN
jgi:hypothetical protein